MANINPYLNMKIPNNAYPLYMKGGNTIFVEQIEKFLLALKKYLNKNDQIYDKTKTSGNNESEKITQNDNASKNTTITHLIPLLPISSPSSSNHTTVINNINKGKKGKKGKKDEKDEKDKIDEKDEKDEIDGTTKFMFGIVLAGIAACSTYLFTKYFKSSEQLKKLIEKKDNCESYLKILEKENSLKNNNDLKNISFLIEKFDKHIKPKCEKDKNEKLSQLTMILPIAGISTNLIFGNPFKFFNYVCGGISIAGLCGFTWVKTYCF